MTDAIIITAGMRVHGFEVLSVDPTGKRACCSCACGGVHIVSIDALCAGTAACAAVPWTRAQIAERQAENLRQRRARDLKDWRPGERS